MSATYGLVSQVVANIYKAFASHFELPRKNFDKYHEPYKDKTDSPKGKCIEIKTVDHVLPEAYIEKTPFPAKMKEYSVITSVVNKSAKKPIEPEEQIKVEPAVAIVKDLVTENVEDGHIIFCEDASNVVLHPNKSRKASVHVLSVRIGDHFYYGFCDIGASISAIPYELYTEIMHEIGSCELEDIDVVIRLANRETISPLVLFEMLKFYVGLLPPALSLNSFPCVEEAIPVTDEFCDQYRALRREVEILQEENKRLRRMLEYYSIPITRPPPPYLDNNESLRVLVQNCQTEKLKLKLMEIFKKRGNGPSPPKE
ncbi:hypothetical protein QYE76_029797 [Lolium multiflorum]|uniref:Uncharacterized protein n=1 Tax=Lolium multiflorum TaxID=4521 RepID=A0AAD8VH06_LOLMU|nr:hypothetical protein QYE76_029797 [Lolium multiflorum]